MISSYTVLVEHMHKNYRYKYEVIALHAYGAKKAATSKFIADNNHTANQFEITATITNVQPCLPISK